MAIQWFTEASDQKPDPVTGSKITRLTGSMMISNNLYCEQPYTTPDGKRNAVVRYSGFAPDYESAFYVADLDRSHLVRLKEISVAINSAWGEWFYYLDAGKALTAVSLVTFERKCVCSEVEAPGFGVSSVSPDQRYILYATVRPGPTNAIVRFDTKKNEWRILFEHPEIINPHVQFNPVTGADIMIQHNRGSTMAPDGTPLVWVGKQGTTLFVINRDGKNQRPVPSGPPHTAPCTGHECFVANTGRVAFTVGWDVATGRLDPTFQEGNLFTARPGDRKPKPFPSPKHRFNHICVSRCGRYFLCDCYAQGLPGPVPLVVGNLETGKHRTLLQDCKASCGSPQFSHPHAYFTADLRHVIYNADPAGVPQVFKATIPDGFLASLG